MLPKENRVSSDFDFKRIRRLGSPYHSPYFSLTVLKEKDADPSRFGFVISSRVSKRAVKRNRIKRLIRTEVEELLPRLAPGYWAVFWIKPKALEAEPGPLRDSVSQTLRKAGLLN